MHVIKYKYKEIKKKKSLRRVNFQQRKRKDREIKREFHNLNLRILS